MVASLEYDVVPEVACILALLSSDNLYTSPNLQSFIKNEEEDEDDEGTGQTASLYELFRLKHRKFRDETSDHITLYNVFGEWLKRRGTQVKIMRKDELYEWCWDNLLSMRYMLVTTIIVC